MGFEHQVSFTPPLASPTRERLLTCLKNPPAWPLVDAQPNGNAHMLRYAYAAGVTPVWGEDFLVDLSDQKLYVLFHTGQQEQAVLGWLQHCLQTSGLLGAAFQEL
jgi:hypothetical protein